MHTGGSEQHLALKHHFWHIVSSQQGLLKQAHTGTPWGSRAPIRAHSLHVSLMRALGHEFSRHLSIAQCPSCLFTCVFAFIFQGRLSRRIAGFRFVASLISNGPTTKLWQLNCHSYRDHLSRTHIMGSIFWIFCCSCALHTTPSTPHAV